MMRLAEGTIACPRCIAPIPRPFVDAEAGRATCDRCGRTIALLDLVAPDVLDDRARAALHAADELPRGFRGSRAGRRLVVRPQGLAGLLGARIEIGPEGMTLASFFAARRTIPLDAIDLVIPTQLFTLHPDPQAGISELERTDLTHVRLRGGALHRILPAADWRAALALARVLNVTLRAVSAPSGPYR